MSVAIKSPQVRKSHVSGDAVGMGGDGLQPEAHATPSFLIEKVMAKLNTTLRDCRVERDELTSSVESQLRDMRTETMTTRSEQQQLQREIRALQEKLQSAVIQRASIIAGNAERISVQELAKTARRLTQDTQQGLSEVELLKASVFHDRIKREELQQREDAEDEALEARLLQAEAANDELRRMALRLQEQNTQLVTTLQHSNDMLQQWQRCVAQQQGHIRQITEKFGQVQAEHRRIVGSVESLVHSLEQYKAGRDETLRKLENNLVELEQQCLQQQERWRCFGEDVSGKAHINGSTPWERHHDIFLMGTAACRPLRKRLEHFYGIYNPEKVCSVSDIIDEYRGAEEELMAALEVHYGAFGFFFTQLNV
ncbi:hypothetical protein TraAM80_04854 [Trypanosoma rangeli]|uniref:Uncharacterized protein n=1 Tax=Trypanosoma rangeli TaxID=5698 RepID=A0A422NIB2_TRYRA|nr:uncharacterized protein TraAM80_04854 [Trypanosoma rangeli]RNF05124.1 hypothetical protein TraAM80_04854 [Trypanosoma rangeli]|eukprot:RNF05124.1 hypothetical protein TraAM80_04854 [Trypanosoma rangeli]